jgi:MFS family permease
VAASGITVRAGAGVLGGWLAIMPAAVVTLTLRVDALGGNASDYATMLAAGWLVMVVALIGAGRLSDALLRRTGQRALLVRIAVPLIALSGVCLAVAPTPAWLAAAWILAQIPSAMVITTSLAVTGDALPPDRRGLASGIIGAAPIIALFIGSFLVSLLTGALPFAFILPAFLGALLATPMMVGDIESTADVATTQTSAPAPSRIPLFAWGAFLAASFLLSWATSTTNGFIVRFVQEVSNVASGEAVDQATNAVIVASLLAIVASVVAGLLSRGRMRALVLWAIAATACGIALTILLAMPTAFGIVIAAALFGIGFGVANGVELAVVLVLRTVPAHLGRDLGTFTAVTTAPFVLVPVLATAVIRTDVAGGLIAMFSLAIVVAFAASVVAAVIVARRRTAIEEQPHMLRQPTQEQPHGRG